MKRQIILLTVLVLLSLQASSKISLGLNGGMIYNTPPFATNEIFHGTQLYNNRKGKTAAVIGAKVSIDLSMFQFGVGVRYGKTGFSYNQEDASQTGLISEYTSEARFITPYVFVNYRINLPKSYLHFGINAGYVKYGDRTNIFSVYLLPPTVFTQYELGENTSGMLNGGLQAGYTFNVTDKLGLQFETGVNYTRILTYFPAFDVQAQRLLTTTWEKTSYLQIPVTAGIVYSF